jgi:hypothetical protein
MNTFSFICNQCLESSRNNLSGNRELITFLNQYGISKIAMLDAFNIGYARERYKNDRFKKNLIIPLYDEKKEIMNITGYSIWKHPGGEYNSFNPYGIFNQDNLNEYKELILTDNPIDALFLIQNGFKNTTFIFGDYTKYIKYFLESRFESVICTFTKHNELLYSLARRGITIKQAGKICYWDTRRNINLTITNAIPVIYKKN